MLCGVFDGYDPPEGSGTPTLTIRRLAWSMKINIVSGAARTKQLHYSWGDGGGDAVGGAGPHAAGPTEPIAGLQVGTAVGRDR